MRTPIGKPADAPPPLKRDELQPVSWPRTPYDEELMLQIGRQKGYYSDELTADGQHFANRMTMTRLLYKDSADSLNKLYPLGLALLSGVHLSVILAELYGNSIATEAHKKRLERHLLVRKVPT